jgi:membrane-associated phospholipid phosphatase
MDRTKAEPQLKPLHPTDVLILAALALFTVLTLLCAKRIPGWEPLVIKNLLVGATYLSFQQIAAKTGRRPLRFALRMIPVTLTYGYLFLAVDKLQLLIHGQFLDGALLRLESLLFGGQPLLWLERFTRPALTEYMMFAYLFYFAMYPIVCVLVFWKRGDDALQKLFFTLGLANILCDLGFILFPVSGPSSAIANQFAVPLDGYFITSLGEWVRTRLQFPGGSLPSPHCAAATVMWAATWRDHRPLFWLFLPLVLSLYVSTVYCRYHYLTDAVTGVVTAFIAMSSAPRLLRIWKARARGLWKLET